MKIRQLASVLAIVGLSAVFSWQAGACGWAGDGDNEEEDAIVVGADGKPVLETEDTATDPAAQHIMGNRFSRGDGVAQDDAEAVRWYRRAAGQGFAPAQNNLGVMYEAGRGIPRDDAEAATWFRRAAEQGEPHALHSLANMYREGRGVERNLAEAVRWNRKAARKGHAGALVDLGSLYWEGQGVKRDRVRAYMWWQLAAALGSEKATGQCAMAEAAMTPEQIAEGRRLAREWTPATR